MEKLKPLIIRTGRTPDGDDNYFERKQIEKRIWTKIKRKENLLLSSPRRTGKSSILKKMERSPETGFIVKYKSVQSIDSSNEFFKQLYIIMIQDDSVFSFYEKYLNKVKTTLRILVHKIKGISLDGIEFDSNETIDYYKECETLLKTLPDDFNTLLILLDEFPDAVKNIGDNNKKEAIRFLQLNRDLRQNFNNEKIQFLYTGSIGLGNIVEKLESKHLINDIVSVKLPLLKEEEAKNLISRLEIGIQKEFEKFIIDDEVKDYIIKKESWLIPYYIQIIIDTLMEEFEENPQKITKETIDIVIKKIITERDRYEDYFGNWKTRLKQAFEKHEYLCALEILNTTSKKGLMEYNEIYDLGIKHGVDDILDITNVLEHDGYMSRNKSKIYKFNSIILKEWWFFNVAN